ncbi:hypothetical protein EJB05_01245, partial [Eragrostis curvula]
MMGHNSTTGGLGQSDNRGRGSPCCARLYYRWINRIQRALARRPEGPKTVRLQPHEAGKEKGKLSVQVEWYDVFHEKDKYAGDGGPGVRKHALSKDGILLGKQQAHPNLQMESMG